MNEFLEGVVGEFIHIDCNIYPITSFMYNNRVEIRREPVNDLFPYVYKMINMLKLERLNVSFFESNVDDVLELILNKHGIVKISLKGKNYEKRNGNISTE